MSHFGYPTKRMFTVRLNEPMVPCFQMCPSYSNKIETVLLILPSIIRKVKRLSFMNFSLTLAPYNSYVTGSLIPYWDRTFETLVN